MGFGKVQKTGGYSESNLLSAVNKTSNDKKKLLYTQNTCILKLLLSVVTAGIEVLFVSGNRLLYALSEKSAA
jgi:hypothetical protein